MDLRCTGVPLLASQAWAWARPGSCQRMFRSLAVFPQETVEEAPGFEHLPTGAYLAKFGPYEHFGQAHGHFPYTTKRGSKRELATMSAGRPPHPHQMVLLGRRGSVSVWVVQRVCEWAGG